VHFEAKLEQGKNCEQKNQAPTINHLPIIDN
jgi:hypothetical protein